MFDWFFTLTAVCLTCQKNKPKAKHRKEVPLEEWQKETTPIRTIHIDHRRPLHAPSNRNLPCFLVISAFCRFFVVYPVKTTGAQTTLSTSEKFIGSFGNPQATVHYQGTALTNAEYNYWTREFGNTLGPWTAHSLWTNGQIKTQNQHIARFWRNTFNDAGNSWSSPAQTFAFAHNTSVNYKTGKTTFKTVLGTKPQIPMSLNLGLYRNKQELSHSESCKDFPPHSHSEINLKYQPLDTLLQPPLFISHLERQSDFNWIHSGTFERCGEQTAKSHAYRNWLKQEQHFKLGQTKISRNWPSGPF